MVLFKENLAKSLVSPQFLHCFIMNYIYLTINSAPSGHLFKILGISESLERAEDLGTTAWNKEAMYWCVYRVKENFFFSEGLRGQVHYKGDRWSEEKEIILKP